MALSRDADSVSIQTAVAQSRGWTFSGGLMPGPSPRRAADPASTGGGVPQNQAVPTSLCGQCRPSVAPSSIRR